MIDPALEKRLADCKSIRGYWRQFRDFYNSAINKEPITQDKELAFLKIKSNIAMLHDMYLDTIKGGLSVAQNVMQIVGRSITLKHVAVLSMAETKKFEIEWHEAFLQMEETITRLDEERARLAKVTSSQHMRMTAGKRLAKAYKAILGSTFFKLGIVVVVLAIAIAVMAVFNVPDKMYQEPKFEKFGVLFFKVFRMFNADYPFRDIEKEGLAPKELPGNKPGGWKPLVVTSVERGLTKDKAAAEAKWTSDKGSLDLSSDLAKADKFYSFEVGIENRNTIVRVYYFQLKTVEDAQALMDKYAAHLQKLGKGVNKDSGSDADMLRAANVIALCISGEKSLRTRAADVFFGVKIEEQ